MSKSIEHEIIGLLYLILYSTIKTPALQAVILAIVLGHAAAALYYGIKELS